MNNSAPATNRTPLIIALAGAVLLVGLALYLFARPAASGADAADRAVAAAGMSAKRRAATEAIVRAYILEHPEIIPEAIEVLQKRENAKKLTAAGGKLATPFPGAEAGNPRGDVTLVEFTDYGCGYCRASVADVDRLIAADKGVRVVYREMPILSAQSREAALWALAAARQGKHKAFHDALFATGRPNTENIAAAAKKAGLDMASAKAFAASPEAVAEVEANLAFMQQLGFGGTPTFVIGDQILEGAVGYDALRAAVEKARKG